jgi:hypothetical protein
MSAFARTVLSRRVPLALLVLLAACKDDSAGPLEPGSGTDIPGDVTSNGRLSLNEAGIVAERTATGVEVLLPVSVSAGRLDSLTARVRILDETGTEVARGETSVSGASPLVNARINLPGWDPGFSGSAASGVMGGHIIAWEVQGGDSRVRGRRSFYEALQKYDVTLIAPSELYADTQSHVRVIARDSVGGPLVGQPISLELVNDDGSRTALFSGATDEFGVMTAPVEIGPDVLGSSRMIALMAVDDSTEQVETTVRVTREQRVLVTTDKPVYQPGQRIHVRTLALNRPSLRPAADREVTFEVQDARGNRVFRNVATTDAYGVASLEIPLASELNEGTWQVNAIVDGVTTTRSVRVEPYSLPKFGVSVQPDRSWYRPGDTALVDIDAQYFFGQPVAGATVRVEPYTFDVGFNPLPVIEVELDENGLGRVEIPIPSFLVGQELNDGNAFIRVDMLVTDATGHTETLTRNLVVARAEVVQTVLPGSDLIPGQTNTFYVLTRTPSGEPVSAENRLVVNGQSISFATDDLGFAEVEVPLDETMSWLVRLETTTGLGNVVEYETTLGSDERQAVAVLPDRSVYAIGESAELMFRTNAGSHRMFIDVIRDGQTLLTETVDVVDGEAAYTLDLSSDLTGALEIHGYVITTDARIVRGTRAIYVDGTGGLTVNYETDREEYRPGEEATIEIQVRDVEGNGVQSAVGLTVVDEAVFALQDMRPGLERVYFELESELLEPAYNLYGWGVQDVVSPGNLEESEREVAADVVFASTDLTGYGYETSGSLAAADATSISYANAAFRNQTEQLAEQWRAAFDAEVSTWSEYSEYWSSVPRMQAFLDSSGPLVDVWGRGMTLTVQSWDGQYVSSLQLRSSGPDEITGTDDDAIREYYEYDLTPAELEPDWNSGGGPWDEADASAGDDSGGPWPPDPEEDGDDESANPRVRQYFPETLWVQPDIITDENGNFSITIPMADSITTWRMTSMASSATGQIGSGTDGIRVFQPFFADINFPATLTQNDSVDVPVALFNYLETAQTVQLRVDTDASGDWFTLTGDSTATLELQPGEVTVHYFPVTVNDVGRHAFQVTAIGSEESDAVRRVVTVLPDGKEFAVSESDRLTGTVERTISIPEGAIEGGTALRVNLYPGLFAQVVEGLDSLLRMPDGCFEQTSSTTYPNVLVAQYLRDTDQVSPELELRANEYIAQGYQKLVSFEVEGGGFEWFGQDPAHRILTSYGLFEFTDMAEVFPVDEAMIGRTQSWLASQQEPDGRFRAAPEGIQEGATNNFTDSDVRATSYVAWALAYSGYSGSEVQAAANWLRGELSSVDDPYTLAMAANLLLTLNPNDTDGQELLERLEEMKESETTDSGELNWWSSESQSLYYGGGDSMSIETTALVLQAYMRGDFAPTTVNAGIGWLLTKKGSFGAWESTQATIQTLRTFLMQLENAVSEVEGTVEVYLDDALVDTLEINALNADLLQTIELGDTIATGDHVVRMELAGEGALMFQIAGSYWLPWSMVDETPVEAPLSIEVAYDRTQLEVDEQVEVTVTVTNNSDTRQDMVMIDMGVPPGFDVIMSDFDTYTGDPESGVTRVERAGRQLTVYLYGLDAGESLTLTWHMIATLAVRAQTPPSAVWLYYQASVRSESEPVEIEVR